MPYEPTLRMTTGSRCQIYSKSNRRWFDGEVAGISTDEEGEWLNVTYEIWHKQVQRYSADIRPHPDDLGPAKPRKTSYPDSYQNYVHLYDKPNRHNNKVVRRGTKRHEWILSLQVDDRLDIYHGRRGNECWHIGTVIDTEQTDNCKSLLIHYDGWGTKWDEWVEIDASKTIPPNVRPLHTFTPLHRFLTDPHAKVCRWGPSSKWQKCKICQNKFCAHCLGFRGWDRCGDCMHVSEREDLFDAIDTISEQYSMDVYVIRIIVDYSVGVTIQCSNVNKGCQYEEHFDTKYDYVNYNWDSMYHYCPKYACDEGTQSIFGQLIRAFCLECYRNELVRCEHGCNYRDVRGTLCHNHTYAECTICGHLHVDAGKDAV